MKQGLESIVTSPTESLVSNKASEQVVFGRSRLGLREWPGLTGPVGGDEDCLEESQQKIVKKSRDEQFKVMHFFDSFQMCMIGTGSRGTMVAISSMG